eukprot:377263-Rhodomonas_salina.1
MEVGVDGLCRALGLQSGWHSLVSPSQFHPGIKPEKPRCLKVECDTVASQTDRPTNRQTDRQTERGTDRDRKGQY